MRKIFRATFSCANLNAQKFHARFFAQNPHAQKFSCKMVVPNPGNVITRKIDRRKFAAPKSLAESEMIFSKGKEKTSRQKKLNFILLPKKLKGSFFSKVDKFHNSFFLRFQIFRATTKRGQTTEAYHQNQGFVPIYKSSFEQNLKI